MNNELQLIAELLSNPREITALDIDPDWFGNESLGRAATVLNQLKGTHYQLEDVYRELKAINPFEAGTLESWQQVASQAKQLGVTHQLTKMVHSDYLDRQLRELSKSYSTTGSNKDASRLHQLLEEKQSIQRVKSNGMLAQSYQTFLKLMENEEQLLTTYPDLDTFLGGGLSGGQLIVIGARPAVGKTALGINLAMKILEANEGVASDFFTLEMTDWQLMSRVISKKASINSVLLRQPSRLSDQNKEKAKRAFEETMKHDFRIYGAEYEQLNDIKAVIRKRAQGKQGKYVAFIDYAGLINVSDSRKNERQAMNEVTRDLKILTNELQIAIVLFAQLNRGIEGRQNKAPTLADLKESGSLEQDANVVLLLSRNKEHKDIVDVQIAKNREGMTGCIPFKFIPQFMDFSPDYGRSSSYDS